MITLALDFGNVAWKWVLSRKGTLQYGTDMHAIVPLTDRQWQEAIGRGTPAPGYLCVNGQPFVVGAAARRHLIRERPKGAARYTREYYGAGLAYALSESFRKDCSVSLFASHAPGDVQYVPQLEASAMGTWRVVSRRGEFTYNVVDVQTYDEPLGGYIHFAFTAEGMERSRNPLRDATTLVIDIGGETVDVAAVDPGGQIDPGSLGSTRTGFRHVMEQFEREMRAHNRITFQDTGDLDIKRVQRALMTGQYMFGKKPIDCSAESSAALNGLAHDVAQILNAVGGIANYDVILLTGGGSVVMLDTLAQRFPHGDFRLAEADTNITQFANAIGGFKYSRILRLAGGR